MLWADYPRRHKKGLYMQVSTRFRQGDRPLKFWFKAMKAYIWILLGKDHIMHKIKPDFDLY